MYDIHAHLLALEAVLQEVSDIDVDVILFGGDVAWGPHPRQTIQRLMELEQPARFILGNSDREVSQPLDETQGLDASQAEINVWCSDQMSGSELRWLSGHPATATLHVEGLGNVLFCHGSPRSDEEIITMATPEDRVGQALSGTREQVVVCGHTHIQFDRMVQGRRLINAGSVGLPYEGTPGAYWALLGPGVSLHRTMYDIDRAAEGMRDSGCPHVEDVFIDTITNPPNRDDTTRHFEKIATKSS